MSNTDVRKTRCTPWLRLKYGYWHSNNGTEYVCENRLYDYFNLKTVTDKTRIRLRISQESQGDDYEIVGGDLPAYVDLRTSMGDEYLMLFVALGRYLYRGCWIGLERIN